MTTRRPSDLTPGHELGPYRLDAQIGSGTHSRIFLATHTKLARKAAIKVLLVDRVEDPKSVQRFVDEARIVNEIRHPNIIDIRDVIEAERPRCIALVMEHIAGPSIKALHASGRRMPFSRAMAVAAQLCEALKAAHAIGVIHRDIKPGNLLLTTDPDDDGCMLKVVDFGIAKITAGPAPLMTEQMIGTPAYMAPEQISGKPAPSRATDVYAAGEVLYELLTGERMFAPSTIPDLIRRKLRGEIPEFGELRVPGGVRLGAIIRACLAQRPDDRPSLEELSDTILSVCPEAQPPKPSRGVRVQAKSKQASIETVTVRARGPKDTQLVQTVRAGIGSVAGIPSAMSCPTLVTAPEETQIMFEHTVEDADVIEERWALDPTVPVDDEMSMVLPKDPSNTGTHPISAAAIRVASDPRLTGFVTLAIGTAAVIGAIAFAAMTLS